MGANKQIGWSQESILLHGVSKQLERLAGLIAAGSSAPVDTSPIELDPANGTAWNNGKGDIDTNTSFGMFALQAVTTGFENAAFGYQTLSMLADGDYNTAVGANAMRVSTIAIQNTAVGAYALEMMNNTYNTAVGAYALSRSSGTQNTAVGVNAGKGLTGGTGFCTAIGYNALGGVNGQNTTGASNTVMGYQAGGALTTGTNNLLIENIITGTSGVTTGSFNIIINGVGFSGITTGSNNVIIGGFNGTITNGSDQVIIGTGNGVRRIAFDSTGQMTISNTQPAGVAATTEKLLVRDTAAGAVKYLDYVAIDTRTAAASAATLNTAYPNARNGFRAICMAIVAGPLIYTKTSTGWSSTAVLNVT